MALSDAAIRALKPAKSARKVADAEGLFVYLTPGGSKLWRWKYRFSGKEKVMAFGVYPAISLASARKRRDHAKAILASGRDPSVEAKLDKIRKAEGETNTFSAIADELITKDEKEGRAPRTLAKKRWLLGMARADIGPRPVAQITPAEILTCLRKVERAGNYETARRMRGQVGAVFRFAIATARAETDPTLALRGALTAPTVTHRAAILDRTAFGGLLRSVWDYQGQPETKAALQLLTYLFSRPGELRLAEWREFDLEDDTPTWAIPAARTKMRREHRKFLPPQAVAILRDLHQITGDGSLVFPSVRSRRRAISDNTTNAALRRMGYRQDQASSHGFRSSASTILNESGLWSADAIEKELAHADQDDVRRAYARGLYWDERMRMMKWWADEVDQMREGAEIVPVDARGAH